MRLRALRDACLGGFLYGALLYGAVLSLVHVVHNHLGSVRDALITYAGFLLLYGLWGAAFFALASLAAIPFSRPEAQERRGLWLGLLAFNLLFWELFFLYGLSYDQAPLHPTGKWDMLGALALLALPIALGVALGSWLMRDFLKEGDFNWQSAALLKLLAERPQPRFFNFYTHQPDSGQHRFWKWYQPDLFIGVKARDVAAKGDIIPGIYRGFDGFLARLLAEAGPDTVVIIASDHGHSPTIVHSLYTQHRHGPPGILLMWGGPVRRGLAAQDASVFDLYPTVLYLLGLPVPQDASSKVLTGALDPGFVRLHPVRRVPTYRDLGLSPNLPGAKRDDSMNRQEIEKLKSLGYIF